MKVTPAKLTLRKAYERFYHVQDLGRQTRCQMRSAIRAWERLTGNPPLSKVDNATAETFRAGAIEEGLAPETVKYYWKSIRSILRRVGPVTDGNPWALEIIPRVPAMRPVVIPFKRPPRLTMEELSRIYLAARHMDKPTRHVPNPGFWWQALIVLAYFTGLRLADLLKATWGHLDESAGTLFVRTNKTHIEADLPLTGIVLGHLARLERGSDRIFEISQRRFHRITRELREQSGVKFTFRDFRKTSESELEAVAPGMARVLHLRAPRDVQEKYYLNRLPDLRDAIERMAVPIAFKHGPKMAIRALKESRRQFELRAVDFAMPEHPPAGLFQFNEAGFSFSGRFYSATGPKHDVLRVLVESGGACSQRTLWTALYGSPFPGKPEDRRPLHRHVSDARKLLRRVAALPEGFNPIVPLEFDRDHCCRYGLFLPSALWTEQKGGAA